MFEELLNKQVCVYTIDKNGKSIINQHALSCLYFMYPNFQRIKSEFELYPGEPFIYLGDLKWVNKINQRTEKHIIVSSTGEYDLTDKDTLVNLAYLRHNKKPPHYMKELLDVWTEEQFFYNWKLIWVTGSPEEKEINKSNLFISLMNNLNSPINLIKTYLQLIDTCETQYLESHLLKFIDNSLALNGQNNTQNINHAVFKSRFMFKSQYSKNVTSAVDKIVNSPIDNTTLKVMNFLLDLTIPTRRMK